MKLLLILLSLVFISCEKETSEEVVAEVPVKNNVIVVPTAYEDIVIEYVDGDYKSGCIVSGSDSHYFIVTINNYTIRVSKFVAWKENKTCEGMKSVTVATYNINGSTLDYVDTTYQYQSSFGAGGSYICGQSHMTSGDAFNIDGIGCSESFENKLDILSSLPNDSYSLLGVPLSIL